MKRKCVAQDVKPDTSKPTAIFEAKEGRAYTVSVALPGSIIIKYMETAVAYSIPLTEPP